MFKVRCAQVDMWLLAYSSSSVSRDEGIGQPSDDRDIALLLIGSDQIRSLSVVFARHTHLYPRQNYCVCCYNRCSGLLICQEGVLNMINPYIVLNLISIYWTSSPSCPLLFFANAQIFELISQCLGLQHHLRLDFCALSDAWGYDPYPAGSLLVNRYPWCCDRLSMTIRFVCLYVRVVKGLPVRGLTVCLLGVEERAIQRMNLFVQK